MNELFKIINKKVELPQIKDLDDSESDYDDDFLY